MKEFWTSMANAFSGENGPLYVALCAITGLTLGWKFLDKNYQAQWEGGKICPTGLAPVDYNTAPMDNLVASLEANDAAVAPAE